jgi:hypothetical protein
MSSLPLYLDGPAALAVDGHVAYPLGGARLRHLPCPGALDRPIGEQLEGRMLVLAQLVERVRRWRGLDVQLPGADGEPETGAQCRIEDGPGAHTSIPSSAAPVVVEGLSGGPVDLVLEDASLVEPLAECVFGFEVRLLAASAPADADAD